jgi:hypothetical protein
MLNDDTRNALTADIAAHLLTNGSKNWRNLRTKYPTVPDATFWRHVKKAKKAQAAAASGSSPPAPHNSQINSGPDFRRVAQILPRAAYLETLQASDVLEEVRAMMADVEALRSYATDLQGKVRHPAAFLESIKMRERILMLGLREMQNIWDVDYEQRFYDQITTIFVERVPRDLQLEIIEALEELNKARGIPARPAA